MRIIAGRYKKSNLVTVKGNNTRPTTDYIKEVIYSILPDCEDMVVLDLYAGSGGLGLEALSRRAKHIDFVEASEKAIKVIFQNVEKLKCKEMVKINKKRVSSFLKKCTKTYDLILMDPPYNKKLINPTIELILENNLLKTDGIILVEHSPRELISEGFTQFITFDKNYGETQITLLELKIGEEKNEVI